MEAVRIIRSLFQESKHEITVLGSNGLEVQMKKSREIRTYFDAEKIN